MNKPERMPLLGSRELAANASQLRFRSANLELGMLHVGKAKCHGFKLLLYPDVELREKRIDM